MHGASGRKTKTPSNVAFINLKSGPGQATYLAISTSRSSNWLYLLVLLRFSERKDEPKQSKTWVLLLTSRKRVCMVVCSFTSQHRLAVRETDCSKT